LNEELQDYETKKNLKYSADSFRSRLARQKSVAGYCQAVSAYFLLLDSLTKAVLNNHHYCDKSRQLITTDALYGRFRLRYPSFTLHHADSVYLEKWQRKFLAPLKEKEEDGILSDNYLFFINQQVKDSSLFNQKFVQATLPFQHIEATVGDVMPILRQLEAEGTLNKTEVEVVNLLKELQLESKLDSTIIEKLNSLTEKHKEYINNQLGVIMGDRIDSIMSDVVIQTTLAAIKESKYTMFSKDIFLINQINTYRQVHAKLHQSLSPMIASAGLRQVEDASARETDFRFEDAQSMQIFQQVFNPYKGKILYIDFWGTYCTPCWAEGKYMEKLREHLKDKDVVFIFICIDDDKKKWLADKEKFAPGAEHLFVEGDTATMLKAMFNISGVPHSVIIGKDGNVVSAEAPRPVAQQEIDRLINAAD
jgi:thiol-disulfide isomerase/thioredoxin